MRLTMKEVQQIVATANVTPVWLLPFMRLVKGPAQGDYAKAYAMLPYHLPKRVRRPSTAVVAVVLAQHNLA